MTSNQIDVIISGGSGVIGGSLRKKLHQLGIRALILSRNEISVTKNELLHKYSLGQPLIIDHYPLNKAQLTFFHLAHDFSDRSGGKENINFIGLKTILSSLGSYENLNTVYVSTPMKDNGEENSSIYQKQKRICEKLLNNKNDSILRPSLIVSPNSPNTTYLDKIRIFGLPVPIPRLKNKIAPIELCVFTNFLICFLSNKEFSGKFLIKGEAMISFKKLLYKYYHIKSFECSTWIFKALAQSLRFTQIEGFWLISEKILGLINLPDLTQSPKSDQKDHWKQITLGKREQDI